MKPHSHSKAGPNFGYKSVYTILGIIFGALFTLLFQNCALRPDHAEALSSSTRSSPIPLPEPTLAKPAEELPPWGRIHYTPLALSRPVEMTNDFTLNPPHQTRWVFKITHSNFEEAVKKMAVSPKAQAYLLDRKNWDLTVPGKVSLVPTAEFVLGLGGEERNAIYSELAKVEENKIHVWPFRFRIDGIDEWFADCALSSQEQQIAKQMIYTNVGTLAFADTAAFIQLTSLEKTKELIRCVSRVSTFVMRVEMRNKEEAQKVLSYWKLPGTRQDYAPYFESVTRNGESLVNIILLLPDFARVRLYTFPTTLDPNATKQNCVWSALNFGSEVPDNGFYEESYIQQKMLTEFTRVMDGKPRFGDILVFHLPDTMFVHMCVYLADDVVFTKNGTTTSQPWQLMKLQEVTAVYSTQGELSVRAYRRIPNRNPGYALNLESR